MLYLPFPSIRSQNKQLEREFGWRRCLRIKHSDGSNSLVLCPYLCYLMTCRFPAVDGVTTSSIVPCSLHKMLRLGPICSCSNSPIDCPGRISTRSHTPIHTVLCMALMGSGLQTHRGSANRPVVHSGDVGGVSGKGWGGRRDMSGVGKGL